MPKDAHNPTDVIPQVFERNDTRWGPTENVIGYSRLIQSIGLQSSVLRRYEGVFNDGRATGNFHLLTGEYDEGRVLVMPPGGIHIAKGFRHQGLVKDIQYFAEQVASKTNARIFAIIDRLGEWKEIMRQVEQAGYVYAGVSKDLSYILLNHGNSQTIHPGFVRNGFSFFNLSNTETLPETTHNPLTGIFIEDIVH